MNPIVVLIRANAKQLIDSVQGSKRQLKELSGFSAKLGGGLTVAGGGLSYALGLTQVPGMALRAEHSLADLGNIGHLLPSDLKRINQGVLETSRTTNQYTEDLLGGLKILVAKGMDPLVAQNFLKPIGITATGTQASIEDLSNASYALYKNLKIPVNELGKALDIASLAGDKGSFELKNMAKAFPAISASAAQLGIMGVGGVAKLGAALQVATLSAGDSDEAANNFQNFLVKITSQETRGNFMKAGLDLKKILNGALADGKDPITTILETVQSRTKGDPFKIGFLFRDMQALAFVKAMTQHMQEYKDIRDAAGNADGVNQAKFNRMMDTTLEQWKQFKIQLATTILPHLAGPLSEANKLLKAINGNATLVKATLLGITGMLMTGGGLLAFAALSRSLLSIANLVTVLRGGAAIAQLAGAGAGAAGLGAGGLAVGGGALSAVVMSSLVVPIVAAIGATAAYQIREAYRNSATGNEREAQDLLRKQYKDPIQETLDRNRQKQSFMLGLGGVNPLGTAMDNAFKKAKIPEPTFDGPAYIGAKPWSLDISAAKVIGAQNRGIETKGKKSALDVNVTIAGAQRGTKIDINKRQGDLDLGVSHGLLFAQP